MNIFALRAAVSLAAFSLVSGFAATPAMACQGVQFESSFIFLSETKFENVPEGMVQYQVLIQESALRNIHDRSLLRAYVRDLETGERLTSDEGGRTLGIVIPKGTSCQGAHIPGPGQYFVVGTLAEKAGGGPVTINGQDVFYPYSKIARSGFPYKSNPRAPALTE